MTSKMEHVYEDAAVKIEKALLRQYQRKIMSGPSIRKAASINLDLHNKNTKKNLTDIIESGLMDLDIQNTCAK